MAAVVEMGEIDDMHIIDETPKTTGDQDILMNGDLQADAHAETPKQNDEEIEAMEVVDDDDDVETKSQDEQIINISEDKETISTVNSCDDDDENSQTIDDVEERSQDDIEERSDDEVEITKDEQDDSNKADDADADVMIVNDDEKENGDDDVVEKIDKLDSVSSVASILPASTTITSTIKTASPPRRSGRNLNKSKSYVLDSDKESISEDSDIEEVLPQDPLDVGDVSKKLPRQSTIVVKDTKRLVEIASKTTTNNASHSGGKKEPTLVIIDTNSILSGRGPVPINQTKQPTYPVLPVALPAQGVYPANMRATITPIPINTNTTTNTPNKQQQQQQQQAQAQAQAAQALINNTPILPSLTDDMFVVEAPSFIVPYVYEKPPVNDLKEFIKKVGDEISQHDEKENNDCLIIDDNKSDDVEILDNNNKKKVNDVIDETKRHTYFDSPIGKFFVDIGYNLVQEFVQNDLLKQQKRKREREGGQNTATSKTIHSLLKSLEYTKENNQPYKMALKKCEFCTYKTESSLAMAFHLETPHMKNFVYKCNFCPYEVRSPHDILFHMEAEHCVRGRLERAPAFHQCPNCPFEDNQKGKLSRHSVACARKFKPEKNMEPPLDWEPPAKIPRAPRMKQQGLTSTAAMYQAMTKTSQVQFMKMQQNMTQNALNRGRGRPSLGTHTLTGSGSVLVPTNYQISGNQLFQVVGGQELGSRIGGPMGLVSTLSSTSSSVTIQNSSNKQKTVHQPSISITPLPRGSSASSTSQQVNSSAPTNLSGGSVGGAKPGDLNSKNSFVICEICDGYIKDLEQLRNHMQWIHKVKIHPKMIYNRPPLNCQKCQFRFFTDQGLERHLLGSHGLVTSSMQEAANKCKDSGRCPVCGRVYQWKLLNHVARDHNMTLKPAHLSYKCTVCTATFGMYKQFENHVYSAHSVVAKRSIDKKQTTTSKSSGESLLKPLKINDEITIIPQMPKSNGAASNSSSSNSKNSASTSGIKIGDTSISRAERLARRKTSSIGGSEKLS